MTDLSGSGLPSSYAFAQQITRQSGSSFRLSFFMLPRREYRAMCVLYAFMRLTDDLADDLADDLSSRQQETATQSLQDWRDGWRQALLGDCSGHPLFPALREVVTDYQIDPLWLDEVIAGVEYDLSPQLIVNYGQLQRYCYLVAGTVGLCCQAIWRADLERTRELAIACGEAFQLTNILRDIAEDAGRGRCYLPQAELEQFGCQVADFLQPQAPPGFAELMQFQIGRAQAQYRQAEQLDGFLQGANRRMFRVMFRTYRALLERIADDPGAVLRERVRLPKRQKLAILLSAPHRRLQSGITATS
jgi:phytoene synthase